MRKIVEYISVSKFKRDNSELNLDLIRASYNYLQQETSVVPPFCLIY